MLRLLRYCLKTEELVSPQETVPCAEGGVSFAGYDADNKMAECFRNILEAFKHRYLCIISPKLVHSYLNCNIDALYSPRIVSIDNGCSWIAKNY